MTSAAAGRGRPRSSEVDRRILEVALGHLRRLGYSEMSMEHVAAEAGVGKATLYRRYRNKADLATMALASVTTPQFAAEPPDDTRDALLDHLARFERGVARGGLEVLAALVGKASDPELLEMHRERVIKRGKGRGIAILERAQQRGEVRPDADLEAAVEMLVGSYFARRLAGGELAGWAATVVDMLLRGIAAR